MYEQIKHARVGEVIYTKLPARNATSAAHRVGRKVSTTQYVASPRRRSYERKDVELLTRVKVLS